MSLYFFDTYAFYEIINGNPQYDQFKESKAITTVFNITEFNFALKRDGKTNADETTKKYQSIIVDVVIEDIFKAMDLRIQNRKLSIPDAIGYTVAQRFNAKFLTGDREFAKMKNVEFVK